MRSSWMAGLGFMVVAGLMVLETGRPALADSGPQKLCPVLGYEIDRSVSTDYEGKRIYFCCEACVQPFQRRPAKYVQDLEAAGIVFEKVAVVKASSPGEDGKGATRSPVVDDVRQGQPDHRGKRASEREGTHGGMCGTGCPRM